MEQVKRAGCCTICDREVFHVLQVHSGVLTPTGQKIPKRLGQPLADARTVTLRLTNGSRIDLTMCEADADGVVAGAVDLPTVWRICLRSNRWYHENRVAMGGRPLAPDTKASIEADLAALSREAILGIVSVRAPGGGSYNAVN